MKKIVIPLIIFLLAVIALQNRDFFQRLRQKTPSSGLPLPQSMTAQTAWMAGFAIKKANFTNPVAGGQTSYAIAFWYPTLETPRQYTYSERRSGSVTLNASLAQWQKPYPILVFAHGAYGSALNISYFAEYAAQRGFIVAGLDYIDTGAPDFQKPLSFERIEGAPQGSNLEILRSVRAMKPEADKDRNYLFSYLEKHRLPQTRSFVDYLMSENQNQSSWLYQTIDPRQIGAIGHSLGGMTMYGVTGAHPNPSFKDTRIKTLLIFSSPTYPFENSFQGVNIPLMLMVGENDEAYFGDLPRRIAYDIAKPPKYYLVLDDSTHFSFSSPENSTHAEAISSYGLAFSQKYLIGANTGDEMLSKKNPAWAYYVSEETSGAKLEFGTEPPAGENSAREGIRDIILKRLRERRLQ